MAKKKLKKAKKLLTTKTTIVSPRDPQSGLPG